MAFIPSLPPFLDDVTLDELNAADRSLLGSVRPSHGRSIKAPRPGNHDLFGVYFVYISMDNQFRLVINQAYADLNGASYEAVERDLLTVTKNRVVNDPRWRGQNFESLVFKKACWFSLVLDMPGWGFYDFPVMNHDPIKFIGNKEIIHNGNPQPKEFHENHSFFEGDVDENFTVGANRRHLLRSKNFFLNDDEQPITDEIIDYGFEIYVRVPFAYAAGKLKETTIIIDPDGQNQGPDGR